jgi:hypothetical protein
MNDASRSLLLALALPVLALTGFSADAAHCKLGKVYIVHAHVCVGDRSRLAREYVWPRRHYAHLRRPHASARWFVTAHIPVATKPVMLEVVEPSLEEEEGQGKRADPGAEAKSVQDWPPPASTPDPVLPNAFAHSLLFRRPAAPTIWRLP